MVGHLPALLHLPLPRRDRRPRRRRRPTTPSAGRPSGRWPARSCDLVHGSRRGRAGRAGVGRAVRRGDRHARRADAARGVRRRAVDAGRPGEAWLDRRPCPLVDALVTTGLATSKGEARRTDRPGRRSTSTTGGVRRSTAVLGAGDLLHDRYVVLRKGRRDYHLLRVEMTERRAAGPLADVAAGRCGWWSPSARRVALSSSRLRLRRPPAVRDAGPAGERLGGRDAVRPVRSAPCSATRPTSTRCWSPRTRGPAPSHTVCGVLPTDAESANGELPTPDTAAHPAARPGLHARRTTPATTATPPAATNANAARQVGRRAGAGRGGCSPRPWPGSAPSTGTHVSTTTTTQPTTRHGHLRMTPPSVGRPGCPDGVDPDAYDRLRRRVLWSMPTGLYVIGSRGRGRRRAPRAT